MISPLAFAPNELVPNNPRWVYSKVSKATTKDKRRWNHKMPHCASIREPFDFAGLHRLFQRVAPSNRKSSSPPRLQRCPAYRIRVSPADTQPQFLRNLSL